MPDLSHFLEQRAALLLAAMILLACASGGLALASVDAVPTPATPVPQPPEAAKAPSTPEPSSAQAWIGRDIDGDGKADFANPTGKGMRGCDAYGCGDFGSVRDEGGRRHEGADFDAARGQAVRAPISGFVTKIGEAYPDDGGIKFVEITNPAIHFVARVFYVQPTTREGQAVRIGQVIGRAKSLQRRYPGITNHIHLELAKIGRPKIDPTLLITARLAPKSAPSKG
jgi:murein DD-endopeptidase MepM/ murein hydrolase activator NlpD